MRTKILPVKYRRLVEGKFPNAGKNPSIKGMKKAFFGKESMCVMCGGYLYNLTGTSEAERIYALAR